MAQRHRVPPEGPAALAAASTVTSLYTTRYPDDIARLPDDLLGIVNFAHQHTGNYRITDHQRGRNHVREVFPHLITVLDYLAAEVPRLRAAVIADARQAGMSLGELAEPLGQSSRQAVYEEITRLDAARHGRPRDARAWRGERASHTIAAPRVQRPAAAAIVWPARILEAARALLDLRDAMPDDVDYEVELVTFRLPDGEYASPQGLTAAVSLLVEELKHRPDLDPGLREAVDLASSALAEVAASARANTS
jgi:hypothetical protein